MTKTPTGPVSSKWFAAGYREAMTDVAQQYREGGEAAALAWIAANGGTPVDLTLSSQYTTPEEMVALATDNPEVLAAAGVAPVAEPCSTQDTTAAALIPGDVVLGPDGWVIVAEVLTVSALDSVRINPTVRPLRPFMRHYQATVTVQPDADTQSSASCQHFIETGRYLRRTDEVTAADLVLVCGCPAGTYVRQVSEDDVECVGCGYRSA